MKNPLKQIVTVQKQGKAVGIYSCCSANEYVIRAALKKGKDTGDADHFTALHFRLVQSVCQRNGKGIHGEPYAEHDAEKEKFQTEIH